MKFFINFLFIIDVPLGDNEYNDYEDPEYDYEIDPDQNEDEDEEDEDNQILSEQEQMEFSLRLAEEQEKKINMFIQKSTTPTPTPTQNQLQSKELSTISEKTECSYTANNQMHAAAASNTTATSPLNTNQITSKLTTLQQQKN